jgi:bifunctional lysine-specific demethylase and histidyl-hydroxylase NO66
VGDAEGFLRSAYGTAPHRWSSGEAFDDLLDLAGVDRALTGHGLRFPAVRLVRDGEVLDRSSFTRRARTGATTFDDLIDPGRVLDGFAGGATIVLQSLQRWWPPLAAFCRDLELALGHQVQANAYLTPAGAQGLAAHHDTHDVFVLQVAGTKQWLVREPALEAPLPRHRSDHDEAATRPVLFEAALAPGDGMYLPRGFVHSASAQEGVSLHLTIGVLATTVHDLLQRIVDLAADEPTFRRALPVGYAHDDATARATVKAAVADLTAWLERLDTVPVAEELQRRFWANRHPLLGGQLAELVNLDRIDDATVVTRRPGTACSLQVVEGRLRVAMGDRRLELPATTEPAVRHLIDGEAHPVASLADRLDGPSRLVLVRRLVREGLLGTGAAGA